MSESDVRSALEQLLAEALRRAFGREPFSAYQKIGTVKAVADLGPDWHTHAEVLRELGKIRRIGNARVFQLARMYPQIIEVDASKRVRIRPAIFPVVRRISGEYAGFVLKMIGATWLSRERFRIIYE